MGSWTDGPLGFAEKRRGYPALWIGATAYAATLHAVVLAVMSPALSTLYTLLLAGLGVLMVGAVALVARKHTRRTELGLARMLASTSAGMLAGVGVAALVVRAGTNFL